MTNKEKAGVIREVREEYRKIVPIGAYRSDIFDLFERMINQLDPPDERIGRRCKVWDGQLEPVSIHTTGVIKEIRKGENYKYATYGEHGVDFWENARLLTSEEKEKL